MLQPGVGLEGSPAAVPVVVQELLPGLDVAGGDEDEVRHAVDVVQFGLAVPTFTVIDQSPQAVCLPRGIHAGGDGVGRGQQRIIRLLKRLLNPAGVTLALHSCGMSTYRFWESNSTQRNAFESRERQRVGCLRWGCRRLFVQACEATGGFSTINKWIKDKWAGSGGRLYVVGGREHMGTLPAAHFAGNLNLFYTLGEGGGPGEPQQWCSHN